MTAPDWKKMIDNLIIAPRQLQTRMEINSLDLDEVTQRYPMRVNSYYLSLIKERDDPIWKQAIPSEQELEASGFKDPLGEDSHSPVRSIVHRYPDRALFYVTNECSMYCRFCTRKNKVGLLKPITREDLISGLQYIRDHDGIRDVIVSGGDPLILSDERLEFILSNLRDIPHVEIIRIGTRVPVCLPHRVTDQLCSLLKKHHPIYVNTHFNHPNEITKESTRACAMLADAGIPLGNQSVLLKGVNDDSDIMKQLLHGLLRIRVKPYYLYLMDLVKGADHFRTSVKTGLDLINSLRGHTTGLAIPHLVIDAPGGGGKVAIIPDPVISQDDGQVIVKNYEGNQYAYPVE